MEMKHCRYRLANGLLAEYKLLDPSPTSSEQSVCQPVCRTADSRRGLSDSGQQERTVGQRTAGEDCRTADSRRGLSDSGQPERKTDCQTACRSDRQTANLWVSQTDMCCQPHGRPVGRWVGVEYPGALQVSQDRSVTWAAPSPPSRRPRPHRCRRRYCRRRRRRVFAGAKAA